MSLAFPEVLPARLDEAGRIAVDFDCVACGYNLRAQRPGEACPECGRAISAEAQAQRWEDADSGYRQRAAEGTRWLSWGVAAAMPLVYPGLVVMAAAVWRLTGREPGAKERWAQRNGRLLARWLVVLGVPAAIGSVVWAAVKFNAANGLGGEWRLTDTLLTGTHTAVFLGLMFAWRHVFDLAARADGVEAARTLRRLWRRYFYVLLFVAGVGLAVNAYDSLDGDRWLPGGLWLAPAVLALVAAVMTALWWQTLNATRRLASVLGEGA